MKKLVFLCVALLVAPAMADVTFTGSFVGDETSGVVTISYTSDADEPRGIALLLTCTGSVQIEGYVAASAEANYNCFIDYAFTNPDGYDVDPPPTEQHPLADPDNPGVIPSLPALVASVCMGVLDTTGAQGAGPAAADPLVQISVSGTGTIEITADTLRGPGSGVVGSEILSNLSDGQMVEIPDVGGGEPDECVKDTASFYSDWLAFGSPDCWCYVKNCRGDADGVVGGDPFGGYYYVGAADLGILIPAWKVIEPPIGDGLMVVNPGGICADFDRTVGGDPFGGYYRVGAADLGILITNWKVIEPPIGSVGLADCDMTDYNFWVTP